MMSPPTCSTLVLVLRQDLQLAVRRLSSWLVLGVRVFNKDPLPRGRVEVHPNCSGAPQQRCGVRISARASCRYAGECSTRRYAPIPRQTTHRNGNSFRTRHPAAPFLLKAAVAPGIVNVPNGATGVQLQIWDCVGNANQRITPTGSGELKVAG